MPVKIKKEDLQNLKYLTSLEGYIRSVYSLFTEEDRPKVKTFFNKVNWDDMEIVGKIDKKERTLSNKKAEKLSAHLENVHEAIVKVIPIIEIELEMRKKQLELAQKDIDKIQGRYDRVRLTAEYAHTYLKHWEVEEGDDYNIIEYLTMFSDRIKKILKKLK